MVKSYPKASLSRISTTTVVSCEGCHTEIPMREEHWQAPDGNHFHNRCVIGAPTKTKTVEKEVEQAKSDDK